VADLVGRRCGRGDPPSLRTVKPELPAEIELVLARAMAKKPAGRYANIDAFADALADVLPKLGAVAVVTPAALAATEAVGRPVAPTQAALVASAPATAPGKRRAARTTAALVVAGLAVGSLLVANASRHRRAQAETVPPEAAPRSLGVTELPIPPSPNKEAMAAYRAGMQATRDCSPKQMVANFKHATELDPAYGAAHFRLGDILFGVRDIVGAREHFEKARALREGMPERERLFMEADEPLVMSSPSDYPESTRRYTALVERFPDDTEMVGTRSYLRFLAGEYAGALADARRAVELDPANAMAIMLEGWSLQGQGKKDDALRAFERCLAIAPSAEQCLLNHAALAAEAGECARYGEDADRLIAAEPHSANGLELRVNALAYRRAPRETLAEAARLWVSDLHGLYGDSPPLVQLALATGDFAAAESGARARELEVADTRGLLEHVFATLPRVEALVESGQNAEAGKAAEAFLNKRELWEPSSGPINDISMRIVGVAARAGAISPDASRTASAAWRKHWEKAAPSPKNARAIWLWAEATTATTRVDAEAALASMPKEVQPTDDFISAATIGRLYWLAGRIDEAMPLLVRASRFSAIVDEPFEVVRASFLLGEARRAKGETAAACSAYQAVLDRWGDAKPRSVTADLSRARRAALACP
jgi:tetratricopeptide (TPR) repeat protein